MDFLDPKKKRAYNIRLFFGFILMAICLILATTVLALITAGYDINKHNGKIIQNGLVFVNSHPVSANIYVNGGKYGTTNARIELPSGNYSFKLSQNGYRSWSTSVSLGGGSVVPLDYPFLFPTNPTATSAESLLSQPNIATESPNQHWLVVDQPGQLGSFNVIDVTNPKTPITTVSLPSTVLTSEPGTNSLQFVEWSTDNQHILLKHVYPGGYEYIMFDWVTPSDSFNVNATFPSSTFTSVTLDNKQYNNLYLYNSANDSLSVGATSTSVVTPLLSNVLAFDPYGNNELVYTTPDASNTSMVYAKLWYSNQSYILRTLPVASQYLLNIASYSGDSYVVVGSNASGDVYIYQNPLSELAGANTNVLPVPYTLLIVSGNPTSAIFSNSARFIAVQSGTQFAVYDFEEQTHYRYTVNLSLDQPGELAAWMDGDRLTLVSGSKLVIFDFDGSNLVTLTSDDPNFLPAFNSAYDAVYTVAPSSSSTGQYNVLRTSLVVTKTTSTSGS